MKKAIKKIIVAILTIIACISFVLMLGQNPDGSVNLLWNFGWMASLALSAKALDKLGVFNETIN